MAEFQKIETQEELDRIIGERLQRERQKYADYDQLKADSAALGALRAQKLDERVTTLTGQLQQAQTDLAGMKTRAEKAERSLLRSRIAREAGLPAELSDRLTGETEDELKADAQALAKLVQPPKAADPAPLADLSSGGGGSAWDAISEKLKK